MKLGGGSRKGTSFEWYIAKELSLWVSNGKRMDIFRRSITSGGRATTLNYKNKGSVRQIGDISAEASEGYKLLDFFVIECKHYKNLHFNSLLYGAPKNKSILSFWIKLKNLANKNDKLPMLIIKQNRKPILVGIDYKGSRKLLCSEYKINPFLDSRILAQYPSTNLYLITFTTLINEKWLT